MAAYYNEIETFAAQWLRNLIAAKLITAGDVDERSIADVSADDVRGYERAHFFAGIGLWDHALNLAGWRGHVWTGSCPCQPFSVAGKQKADADSRHLWPEWFRLIRESKPPAVFGEQVGAAIRVGWLDDVFIQMEDIGYACGAVDFPACSVGAPHIRQRAYFVAESDSQRRAGVDPLLFRRRSQQDCAEIAGGGKIGELGDATGSRCDGGEERSVCGEEIKPLPGQRGIMGHPQLPEGSRQRQFGRAMVSEQESEGFGLSGVVGNFWSDVKWITCRDGKARPVKSGIFPLVDGYPGRVGILRAAGNAIVPQQAAEFVKAYMDCRP